MRTVQGKVVAVNTIDAPQVIVASVLIKNSQELIVGATVGAAADITKDGRPILLDDMKAGDNVTLTYEKTLHELSCSFYSPSVRGLPRVRERSI